MSGHDPHEQAPVKRYLGLSLGGAKSDRTCLTVVDFYCRQSKAFVVDIFESIGSQETLTADQVLIELVAELSGDLPQKNSSEFSGTHQPKVHILGVDAPLTLPPCLTGCDSGCQGYEKCKKPAVKWMRQQYQRASAKNPKIKHFTPYSQRPVDLYFRYKHPEQHDLFQDETMGANLAPQAARMNYLKNRFTDMRLVEVWPKLTLFYIQKSLRLSKREIVGYRNVEDGLRIREKILERLVERSDLFIYDRDTKKFVRSIGAFDSLLCSWVALQCDLNRVVKSKSDLPLDSGWVQIPEL